MSLIIYCWKMAISPFCSRYTDLSFHRWPSTHPNQPANIPAAHQSAVHNHAARLCSRSSVSQVGFSQKMEPFMSPLHHCTLLETCLTCGGVKQTSTIPDDAHEAGVGNSWRQGWAFKTGFDDWRPWEWNNKNWYTHQCLGISSNLKNVVFKLV